MKKKQLSAVNRERLKKVLQTRDEIMKRFHESGEREGLIFCPFCGSLLQYTISIYNNHVSAKCRKPGCVIWME